MSLPLKKDEEFIKEKVLKDKIIQRRLNLSQEKLKWFEDIRFRKSEVFVNYK